MNCKPQNQPLSPECLIPNVKYFFTKGDYQYVGYFFRLEFISKTETGRASFVSCVFTTKRNGGGKFICAFKPYEINDWRLAKLNEPCEIVRRSEA